MNTKLTTLRMRQGIWEGLIEGPADQPVIKVTHLELPLEGVEVTPNGDNAWVLRVPVPAETLSDGMQTYLVQTDAGVTLGKFSILAGSPLADDVRAEIDLLRAELDMLKQAFRRHCVETAGA